MWCPIHFEANFVLGWPSVFKQMHENEQGGLKNGYPAHNVSKNEQAHSKNGYPAHNVSKNEQGGLKNWYPAHLMRHMTKIMTIYF